eukprot:m.114001 g.114001  ORF g.114001 m.114001 type:complete len:59 (+) comp12808_c0_seq3:1945-2121(+)
MISNCKCAKGELIDYSINYKRRVLDEIAEKMGLKSTCEAHSSLFSFFYACRKGFGRLE